MAKIAMHLHGMGVDLEEKQRTATALLTAESGFEILPLHYGTILANAAWHALERDETDEEIIDAGEIPAGEAYELGKLEGYAEGYGDRILGLAQAEEGYVGMGVTGDQAGDAVHDLWMYVVKYLARQNLQSVVLDTVISAVKQISSDRDLTEGSVVLVAHSLGSLVALDLLRDGDVGPLFSRLVSVGCPAGMVANIPWKGADLLPYDRRKVSVPWIDVYAPRDYFTKFGLDTGRQFGGEPLVRASVGGRDPFPKAHTAYFDEVRVVRKWAKYLEELPD